MGRTAPRFRYHLLLSYHWLGYHWLSYHWLSYHWLSYHCAMNTNPSLADLQEFALHLAWHAGRITLRYFQTDLDTITKEDGTPVTRADREAETWLREAIAARFPDDGIYGEEYGESKGSSGRIWVLDPIDGTRSFVYGVPLYGVLIGVLEDREPQVGVIHLPGLNETFAAHHGGGCTWNGRRVRVSGEKDLGKALLNTSEMPASGTPTAACLDKLSGRVGLRRTWGDCYGYGLVASGRAEVMVDPEASPWDLAAILPVVTEAGGTFTDLEGKETIWSGHGVATNGLLHGAVLEALAS